ncbi:hypothetical protein [Photobacterium carnosum]|jgi:hypothetical protein|uniref:Uncharacterized protein n=1 Tax=Photobacterium carnosum TaxID=2023717 RepID=A0A2N4ULY0_9GAMM|nr:hypothetical protein [Photobacterium carnosum]PLC56017.1 hypothetical protein CIK00_20710 [Photobacterium carnosum]
MAKTFFPNADQIDYVSASAPHPENTQYKISIGLEVWGGQNHPVAKIQMVYDGVVAGRRSPSYPLGSDDFQRVTKKLDELISNR